MTSKHLSRQPIDAPTSPDQIPTDTRLHTLTPIHPTIYLAPVPSILCKAPVHTCQQTTDCSRLRLGIYAQSYDSMRRALQRLSRDWQAFPVNRLTRNWMRPSMPPPSIDLIHPLNLKRTVVKVVFEEDTEEYQARARALCDEEPLVLSQISGPWGYYPARLGQVFSRGELSYEVVRKLGWGGNASVWLVRVPQ